MDWHVLRTCVHANMRTCVRTCKIGYLNGARACSTQLKITMNSDYIKLADIAYEQIAGKFWYGSYGVFRVIIMKDCGFINATRLCSDGGKELKHWYENQISKELLQCLATKLGEGSIDCVVIRKLVQLPIRQTSKKQFQAHTTIR